MENLQEALYIMLFGMGGIFFVLTIIYGASLLLLKLLPEGDE